AVAERFAPPRPAATIVPGSGPQPQGDAPMRYRRSLALAGLTAALLAGLALTAARAEEGKTVELFNGKDLTGWKTFIDPRDKGKTKPEDIWSVKDGVIHCKGRPNGYIITEKDHGDYVLEVEWRWPGKPGNSGVLCHVSGPDKIWPKSFEAQ